MLFPQALILNGAHAKIKGEFPVALKNKPSPLGRGLSFHFHPKLKRAKDACYEVIFLALASQMAGVLWK